jgi:hypothetical protein
VFSDFSGFLVGCFLIFLVFFGGFFAFYVVLYSFSVFLGRSDEVVL